MPHKPSTQHRYKELLERAPQNNDCSRTNMGWVIEVLVFLLMIRLMES